MSYPTYDKDPPCARDGCRGCYGCTVTPPVDKETADLRRKLNEAEHQIASLTIQRDELDKKLKTMTAAASSSASTVVTAIDRIQEMEKVVNAAVDWATRSTAHAALVDAVAVWLKFKKRWS